jgi:DNA polymerase-3 subunit delta'
VLVLHPAERMNAIAANTLLKTLEEPPGNARFVLSSAASDSLLPTIRSRCQALRLVLPPQDVAAAWLSARGVNDANALLAACGGKPLQALEWHEEGIDATLAEDPGLLAAADALPFMAWPLPRLVETLQKVCHDALSVSAGAAPRYFPDGSVRRPESTPWELVALTCSGSANTPSIHGAPADGRGARRCGPKCTVRTRRLRASEQESSRYTCPA